MNVIRSIVEMKRWSQACQTQAKSIALVPTMGNLHTGHISLVDMALTLADKVVVSIYVNPTQFAAHEDLDAYPRTEDTDLAMLKAKNVDVVFMPESSEMYPVNEQINYLKVPAFAQKYEGDARPEHFRGVATVVKKLFDCVLPQHAIFGNKDYQQLLLVKDLVKQHGLETQIHGAETRRDKDGVAKSSRNQYLTTEERLKAPILRKAILKAARSITDKTVSYKELERQQIDFINKNGLKVDYFVIRDALTLEEPKNSAVVILAAARLGKTRLLDNLRLD